ncbi:hypothetical protein [Streptomyces resistomycificus]|uniref:Tetratricopeptide repeat protein n=1 Tax=Streptomyces resistomycificus TaxID=67356 RepID=A0A0L8LWI9_9ACTN|nr:hypothetical protein [Streptomyces resistomycificus]KOG42444.1 hypothetical protein ADK37_04780 [Streptomyces resistomycificus]KUN92595.1 hypothetical protein AQJ84_31885 [Streptomyces resistomycificus]
MLRRRTPLVMGPELDDRQLRRTLAELRPSQQMHGLGTGAASRPLWAPAAELLRATGRDWDRRVHRISVLAHALPPVVTDRWAKDRPQDPDALVLRACARVARVKDTDWSDAWDVYGDCRRAAEVAPEDPTPWLALLRLMSSCGAPANAVLPVWTEAVARDPWNRTVYHQMLRHLSPRRHGTLMEMIDFAERCAGRAPHGSPLALLPLAARVELVAYRTTKDSTTAFAADGHWYEPQAAAETDTALTKWFQAASPPHAEALADLNLLAFALTRMKRTGEAAPVFRRLGRHMTGHPWNLVPDAARDFQYWRDRALS